MSASCDRPSAIAPRRETLAALIGFLGDQTGRQSVDLARALDLGCAYFDLELGVLLGSDEGEGLIDAMGGELAAAIAARTPDVDRGALSMTLGGEGVTIAERGGRPVARLRTSQEDIGFLTLLSSPVHGMDARHGTLCFLDRRPRSRPIGPEERHMLRFMAGWLALRGDAERTHRACAEAERQLQASELRLRSLYEKTPAMLHSIDEHGRLTYVSDTWLAALGYERDEVIGKPSTDFLTPESARHAREVVLPAFLATGQCRDVAYQIVTRRGEIRDILLSAISHRDDDGTFLRSLAVLLDVTDQRQAERALAAKTAALERSNADLARFAHVASHDLQEPLRRIIGYCDLLKEDFGSELSEGATEIAGVIRSGGRRLRLVVNDLLAYLRVNEQLDRAFEPVDMAAMLLHAMDDLREDIAACGARVEAAHLPLVWGRAPLFKMVFRHLLANAVEHGAGHPPMIAISVDDAGDVWRFAVTDSGGGVEPRFADRIFEICQSLHDKDEHEGSGTGLAICRLIVQRCGGEIWLDRDYDRGARFCFTLPKDKPGSAGAGPLDPVRPPSG